MEVEAESVVQLKTREHSRHRARFLEPGFGRTQIEARSARAWNPRGAPPDGNVSVTLQR